MQKLKELLENDQTMIDKKIPNTEIQELIDQKELKEYLVIEDQEYTYQQIYNLINSNQDDYFLQFVQNESLIFKQQNECCQVFQIQQEKNEKNFHELMLERFAKGFQFDIKECYFAHPDIFNYIQLCFEEIKQQQQCQVPSTVAKRVVVGNLRSQQQISQVQQNQKNENQDNSILNGIYGKFNSSIEATKEQQFYFYTYYSSPEITKLIQRCGWKSEGINKEANLKDFYNQCIQREEYSRAAAIACIHFEFKEAIKILKENITIQQNETQQILMVLQGLAGHKEEQEQSRMQKDAIYNILQIFRTFLENLKFEDPYYELIAEFVKHNQFIAYLNYGAQKISIFDRLGLWAKFCEGRKPQVHNLLDNIVLLGKCEESINYLQQYLDEKDDLQLCGIVSIYLYLLDFPQKDKLNKIFNSYIDYLLKNDISINQLLCKIRQFEKEYCKQEFLSEVFKQYQQPQISMICNFCLNPLGQEYIEKQRKQNPRRGNQARDDNPRTNICCYCNHAISNCVVCAQYFTIPNSQDMDRKRGLNQQKLVDSLKIDQAMVWCLSCKHGGHQLHIEEWFELYQKCPACNCECGII